MYLEVLSVDIRDGIRGDKCECAVARAFRRQYPTIPVVAVHHGGVWSGESVVAECPLALQVWIAHYDRGNNGVPMQPFNCFLRPRQNKLDQP